IDERLPEERWSEAGVSLPLPTGTRYLQFRIFFDSTIESAVALDYIEFDYDEPLISGGVVAEVFPPRVALGEEASLRYFLRPFFADGEEGGFNRIELTVPDASTRIDTFKFDGRAWEEVTALPGTNAEDPLLQAEPMRLESEPDSPFVVGQFAQTIVSDPRTGETRLLVKFPLLGASDFKARQAIEIDLRTRLFRGSARFEGSVWNDRLATRKATIPQLVRDGDAVQQVATNATLVVVEDIEARRLRVQAAPNPFTPNGDGVNDAIEFAFDLFLVLDQVEVAVEILDLSGRRMHRVGPVSRTAGQTKLKWDGRNAAGHLLTPGLYLYRLQVAADRTAAEALGVLSLVY
ncbi:MAG: gliding motility-associated C-terminal domain-containing protein, partial [Spirochaetaceae bacterium]|nr:gliding motility-associated C-terminal domain-containing protein [Spirochaetaceae bacterium]